MTRSINSPSFEIGQQGKSGKPRRGSWLVPVALVLSLTACDPGSSGPALGPAPLGPEPPQAEISAWVGATDSELTFSGDFIGPDAKLFTYNDPDCDPALMATCSEQYQPSQSPFRVASDPFITLAQPGYAQLRHGNTEAKTTLSARRFSDRSNTEAVFFKDRFWLVGGSVEDDLWSSVDGRHWVQHTSVNAEDETDTALFASLSNHQLVVFDAAGTTDPGVQLWLIGGRQSIQPTNQVWSSSDGIRWQLQSTESPFTARSSHQVTVFDSNDDGQAELWLLGGHNGVSLLGDVWTSKDGVNWTEQTSKLTNTTPGGAGLFSARYDHQLAAFDAGDGQGSQLWLIGGNDGQSRNDVWSSSNGLDWVQHGIAKNSNTTEGDAFSPRYGHRVMVFDAEGDGQSSRLWLVGGRDENNVKLNDVWSSANGTHWTEHPPTDPTAAYFAPRFHHSLTVADADHDGRNELWVLGGSSNTDSWSSRNGNDWVPQTPHADFSPRGYHQVVTFDAGDGQGEQFWMVGGDDGQVTVTNDVWSSPDGVHWTQQPAVNSQEGEALFPARSGHQLVVFDADGDGGQGSQLWLIGGRGKSGRLNDVWSSPDGKTWTLQTLDCGGACFSARSWHQVVVFDGAEQADEPDIGKQLWLIGGYDGTYRNDVWSSPDGKTWTLQTLDCGGACFSARDGHQVVVFDGAEQPDEPDLGKQLWLIGGYDGTYRNDAWSSPDGKNWTQQTLDCSGGCFSARDGHQVVVFDPDETDGQSVAQDQLWLIGGYSLNSQFNLTNDIWSSTNGLQWYQIEAQDDLFSERDLHQVVVGADPNQPGKKQLWLIGGRAADGYSNQVWRSANGKDWRLSIKNSLNLPRTGD